MSDRFNLRTELLALEDKAFKLGVEQGIKSMVEVNTPHVKKIQDENKKLKTEKERIESVIVQWSEGLSDGCMLVEAERIKEAQK